MRELFGWHRDVPLQEERARLLREVRVEVGDEDINGWEGGRRGTPLLLMGLSGWFGRPPSIYQPLLPCVCLPLYIRLAPAS